MPPKPPTTDVVKQDDGDDDLVSFINKSVQGIGAAVPNSWEDLVDLTTGEIIEFEGSPWTLLSSDDKAKLIGVPFMIADVRAYASQRYGREAVAVMILTEEPLVGMKNNRYVFNDGSTGIFEQVVGMIRRTGRKSGIKCPNGLRVSTYDYQETDFDGKPIAGKPVVQAQTYYIA